MATTTTTPDAMEARDIVDRAMKLPPAAREGIAHHLLQSVEPPPGPPDSDREYWKVELQRRVESIENGTMKMYTLDETLAHMQQVLDEDSKP